MRAAAKTGFATATDLADYLVKKGLPFREAHEVVGKAVAYGLDCGKDLSEMTVEELQQFGAVEADVLEALSLESCVQARNHIGGAGEE